MVLARNLEVDHQTVCHSTISYSLGSAFYTLLVLYSNMATAHRSSASTLFKFSSPSLTSSDILDARTGDVVYRLRSGRTPDTVRIDHGGLIGYKSTCVNRLCSILYDVNDKELGRVTWDADGRAVRMWLTGGDHGRAGIVLPRLCGEDGAEVDPRIISGWEIQVSLQATWRAHVESAAMFARDDDTRMLALFSPNMVRGLDGSMTPADVARGGSGNDFLRLWVAPADLVETVCEYRSQRLLSDVTN